MSHSNDEPTDFYEDVALFIRGLREGGLDDLAQSLGAAMAGATGGETLTHIAYVLDRARKEGPDLPGHLVAQRDAIFARADAALRRVGQCHPTDLPRA
jgi:hypothetical protein